jgi:hypothetical protein
MAGANLGHAALLDELFQALGQFGTPLTPRAQMPDKILERRAAVRLPPDILQKFVRFHRLHYIVCAAKPRAT